MSAVEHGGRGADELAAMRADDLLLDALGRGEPVAGDDKLAGLLGSWRAELDTDPLPALDVPALMRAGELVRAGEPDAEPFDVDGFIADRFAAQRPDLDGGGNGAQPSDAATVPGPRLRPAADDTRSPRGTRPSRWPRGLRLGLAAALLIGAAAGLSATANAAGPDSPLWSVVRLVDPGGADVREAQDTIAKARNAAAEHRYDDARALIDKADVQVARVKDPRQQATLRAQLDTVRRSLPGVAGTAPSTAPGSPGQAGTPTGAPGGQSATTAPGPGAPTGGQPTASPKPPPLLPILPPLLPSPTSPPPPLLPTCLLPTPLLPGLPTLCP